MREDSLKAKASVAEGTVSRSPEPELLPVSKEFARAITAIYSEPVRRRSSGAESAPVFRSVGGWTWSSNHRSRSDSAR